MRKETRRKYYARSNVAASLRGALTELNRSIELASQPIETPLPASLRKVLEAVNQAIEAEKVYILGRKRIRAKLERQKREIETLLQEVIAVPVFPDEKLLASRKRKETVKQPKPD